MSRGLKSTVIPTRDHTRLIKLDQDSHPQYQKESEKDAASGYPGLSANKRLIMARMPDMTVGKVMLGQGAGISPVEGSLPPTRATDDLKHSNDAQKLTTSEVFAKLKELNLVELPTRSIRVKFDLKSADAITAHGKIYLNGAPIGTERTKAASTYETFSEDFNCSAWSPNDLLQVYAYTDNGTQSAAYIRNMQLYYDVLCQATDQDP